MNFEARYIDVGPGHGPVVAVVAIWCTLNGRPRRFTIDNVKASQAAGHRFYMTDVALRPLDVHVVDAGTSPASLHTDVQGAGRNRLADLPEWE